MNAESRGLFHGIRALTTFVGIRNWGNSSWSRGPDSAGAKMLLTQQPRGHDDIGINRPERYFQILSGANSPVLRFAQGIFVANYDRRADLFDKT